MGWLSSLFGVGGDTVAKPVEAVGKVIDGLFTSDEERLDKKIIMERLAMQPGLAQVELNKIEAGHRTIFVAGWRPFIGWVCGTGLAFVFLINPMIQWVTERPGPEMQVDIMMELVIAMLGLGALRTAEKLSGKAK